MFASLFGCGRDQDVPKPLPTCASFQNGSADELSCMALRYAWEELDVATERFSPGRCLGSGTSGTVFKGMLQEGLPVAVKVLEESIKGGFDEEIRLLSRCRHPNVVLLLGFANEGGLEMGCPRAALVYELLLGGDARARLSSNMVPYPWPERVRTSVEVTRGLAHLHRHRPEIFHRDIKTPNILFSIDGTAKIADFGIACLARSCNSRNLIVTNVAGTLGYADPLYLETGVITEASEVYSMGMVVIELLTALPPAVMAAGDGVAFLRDELRLDEIGAGGRVLQRLDERAGWPLEVAGALMKVASLCINSNEGQRPCFLHLAGSLDDAGRGASLAMPCQEHSHMQRAELPRSFSMARASNFDDPSKLLVNNFDKILPAPRCHTMFCPPLTANQPDWIGCNKWPIYQQRNSDHPVLLGQQAHHSIPIKPLATMPENCAHVPLLSAPLFSEEDGRLPFPRPCRHPAMERPPQIPNPKLGVAYLLAPEREFKRAQTFTCH